MVKISVIIPAYNAARFVAEALTSAVSQTFADREIIVVDDGSTDGTSDIVSRFPGVICLRKANGGASSARNAGVSASNGELIAFLDADDVWHPEKLAAQVRLMDMHADCDLGHTAMTEVEGVLEQRRTLAEADATLRHSRVDGLEHGFLNPFLCTSTVIVRRSAFDRVGGFDEALPFAEDIDFFLRVLIGRPSLVRLAPVAVYKREVRGSLGDNSVSGYRKLLAVYAELFRRNPQIAREHPQLARRSFALLRGLLAASLLHRGEPLAAMRAAGRSLLLRPSRGAFRTLGMACAPAPLKRAVKKVVRTTPQS